MKARAKATKSVATPARNRGAFFQQHASARPAFFSTSSGAVQTALTVSQPGDTHEIEAERMADHVMAAREAPFFQPATGLQRQAAEPASDEPRELDRATEDERDVVEETEDKSPPIQRSARTRTATPRRGDSSRGRLSGGRPSRPASITPVISRAVIPSDSGGRAARIDPSRARGPPAVSRDFETLLRSSKGGGRPLPGKTRVEMETSFGADFSGVRVHDGAGADQLSRSIEARAFTHGQDIYFSRNRYQPENQEGKHLLAHELTHVVQQGGGIREGVRRSPEMSRAPPSLQRIPTSMDEVRQEINGLAENIPGFSLATVLIGYNPILAQNVAWSASAFFRGAAGLIPGGIAVYDKLNEGGALDDAFAWIEAQIASRNLTWGRVTSLWDTAWDRMGVTEGISGNLAIFRGVFSGFFGDVLAFISAVVDQLTGLLKELAIAAVKVLFGSDGPAYDMIAMVIGEDPLTGEARPWVTVDFLRAALNFFGFGNHVVKMDETGQLQNAADWLDQQFAILSSALSGLIGGIGAIWDSLGLATLANPLDVLTRTVGVVAGFVGKLLEFVGNLAAMILNLIKQVIIALVRDHVRGIPGYLLFTVIIGVDPVTGEGVPRTAMNFVHGFLEFVPNGEEIYRNLQEGNAIGKAMDWLGEQAAELGLTPGAIVQRFTDLWTSFSIDDLMDPLGAFTRVAGVFLGFIGDVLTLAGRIALKLLEILFEVVMGGGGAQVLAILKQAQGTFKTIVKDPVGFVGNLVTAAKLGFTQFAGNILEHLRTGLLGWLFGALEGAGIQMPASFDLRGILSLAMQILGLTYAQIRPQLVEHLGEALVGHLETAFEVVRILLTEGLAGIWNRITEFLTVSLPEMVIGAVKNFVMERIVVAAVTRIASMLNPAGAVVQAILAIYNTVMFFIERMNQIMATAQAFVSSVSKIAAGNIGDAANAVEQTMASTLPVIISFLARLLGLGGISEKIREIVERIRAPIRTALGRVIGWIVAQARRLGRGVAQAGTGNMTPQEKLDRGIELATAAVNRFRGRAVGEAVLSPLLAGIATRYDFQFLRVIPRAGRWVVSGKVNPEKQETTDARTEAGGTTEDAAADPTQSEQRVLDAFRSAHPAGRVLLRTVTASLVVPDVAAGQVGTHIRNLAGKRQLHFYQSSGNDPYKMVSADSNLGGTRQITGDRRSLFGYSNPGHDSPTGRAVLAGGIDWTNMTQRPESVTAATRTSWAFLNTARFVSWKTGLRNFTRPDAVLGHRQPANEHWNSGAGMAQCRGANLAWGNLVGTYGGVEERHQSSGEGGERYNDPPPTASRCWWDPAHAEYPRVGGYDWDLTGVQAKTRGAASDDPFEREADDAAETVLAGRSVARPTRRSSTGSVGQAISSGCPLPGRDRAEMEDCFGHDFGEVRIHAGAADARVSEHIHARAFTRRADIHFNSGEYQPDSPKGRLLLAHELTHVIQQGAAPALTEQPEANTDMKIRPTFRRSARRVSRRAPDAPFFHAEAPEPAFFSPAADVQKMAADDKEQVDKAPADEPAKDPEEEIQAKPEEEEVQAKPEEMVMAKCECENGNAESQRREE
jgi:hypothetical protein